MNLENTIESPPLIRMGGRIDNTITLFQTKNSWACIKTVVHTYK